MGIGRQGAKARDLENAPYMMPFAPKQYPSDHYPINHFQEFCEVNRLPISPDDEQHVDACALVLPYKTKLMVARSVQRFSEAGVVMVREAEETLGHGEGTFKTDSCLLSGSFEEKCAALEQAIVSVYLSWFSVDGAAYRRKHESSGMGVMVEPVTGDVAYVEGEKYIMPAYAGVGYTNYEGQGILGRAVIGLGSLAVKGGGVVFTKHNLDRAREYLCYQEFAEAVSMRIGKIEKISVNKLDMYPIDLASIYVALEKLSEQGRYYVEWSYIPSGREEGTLFFNQIAEDGMRREPNMIAAKDGNWTVLARGSGGDAYGIGGKECNGIVLGSILWNDRQKCAMDEIGRLLKGYLLVVPPAAISLAGGDAQLTYASVCNCSGVFENSTKLDDIAVRQYREFGCKITSHAGDSAATHFEGICRGENILFLSASTPDYYVNFLKSPNIMTVKPEGSIGTIRIINSAARMERNPENGIMELSINNGKMPIDSFKWKELVEKLGATDNSPRNEGKNLDFNHERLGEIASIIRDAACEADRRMGNGSEDGQILYTVSDAVAGISLEKRQDKFTLIAFEGEPPITRDDVSIAIGLCWNIPACKNGGVVDYLQMVLEKMS
jgi:hypothetical protein